MSKELNFGVKLEYLGIKRTAKRSTVKPVLNGHQFIQSTVVSKQR